MLNNHRLKAGEFQSVRMFAGQGLSHKMLCPQNLISILGGPNKMVLDLKLCMTVLAGVNAKHYKPTATRLKAGA